MRSIQKLLMLVEGIVKQQQPKNKQKNSKWPLQMQSIDERPMSAFRVISQRPFFTNVIQSISTSSTAFNQCMDIGQLYHTFSVKSPFERKYWLRFFFFFHKIKGSLLLLLIEICIYTLKNTLPFTEYENHLSCCSSLQLKFHSSITWFFSSTLSNVKFTLYVPLA